MFFGLGELPFDMTSLDMLLECSGDNEFSFFSLCSLFYGFVKAIIRDMYDGFGLCTMCMIRI